MTTHTQHVNPIPTIALEAHEALDALTDTLTELVGEGVDGSPFARQTASRLIQDASLRLADLNNRLLQARQTESVR